MDTTDNSAARMAHMAGAREDNFSDSGDHGSAPEDDENQQQSKLSQHKPATSQITLQDLEKYYDVPLTEGNALRFWLGVEKGLKTLNS